MEDKILTYNMRLGEEIEKILKNKLQKEIASKMETSPENLSKFIKNLKKGKGITTTTLFSITEALGIKLSEILIENGEEKQFNIEWFL